MLDWDTLRLFLAAQSAGSFRQAADHLNVGHATVRRGIEKLEATLEARVFERTGQGLVLTPSGEALLQHVKAIEAETLNIERRIYGLDNVPRGRVSVSMPPALVGGFFAPILADFTEAYPEIDVEVLATNDFTDLTRHEADVSIRLAKTVQDDVIGRRLVDYAAAPYASAAYLKAKGIPQPGDGSNVEWLGWGDDGSWVKESPFPKAPLRHAIPDVPYQIECAAEGIGMAWLPTFIGDHDPRICRVPGVNPQPSRSVWLLLHGDLRNTARVRAFVDFVAVQVSAQKDRFA